MIADVSKTPSSVGDVHKIPTSAADVPGEIPPSNVLGKIASGANVLNRNKPPPVGDVPMRDKAETTVSLTKTSAADPLKTHTSVADVPKTPTSVANVSMSETETTVSPTPSVSAKTPSVGGVPTSPTVLTVLPIDSQQQYKEAFGSQEKM